MTAPGFYGKEEEQVRRRVKVMMRWWDVSATMHSNSAKTLVRPDVQSQ